MKIKYWILIAFFWTSFIESSVANEPKLLTTGQLNKDLAETESIALLTNDSILIKQSVKHQFSQTDKKDEFYICVKGESLLKGKAIFTIRNSAGIEIFREEFPSINLIGYDLPQGIGASVKDQENFIKSRVLEFFDEKNFKTPAIKLDEVFDEDYSDKDIWESIKNNKNAIGFYFLIGEEDGRSIAYSKRLKKVVLYFNCC